LSNFTKADCTHSVLQSLYKIAAIFSAPLNALRSVWFGLTAQCFRGLTLVAFATASIFTLPAVSFAQSGNFGLELNNAVDTEDGGCRLIYVATNNTGIALEKTSYEVAVFDENGVVSQLLVLEFGALSVGKTKVVQFGLPGQPCAKISRIIVNSLVECSSKQGEHDFCITGLITNSRNNIQFGV